MINENFVFAAAALNLLASLSYVKLTLQGKVRPNRVSFFLWSLAPMIAFAAQLSQGVGLISVMTLAVGLGPLLILIASFLNKKSVWQLSRFDFVCGAVSLLGLALWIITKEGNLAIVFSLLADAFASIPTIVKSYTDPESENGTLFLLSGIGALITMMTITEWTFEYYAFPVYIFSVCMIIFLLVQFKLGKKMPNSERNTPKPY